MVGLATFVILEGPSRSRYV